MDKLYKIGDVAKICDTTIKTIRFYEKIGLLTPFKTDTFTNYRYYDKENLMELNKIIKLKNLDFSLEQIKNFKNSSISEKSNELNDKIKELKIKKQECLDLLFWETHEKNKSKYYNTSLSTNLFVPEVFVNEKQAVGKWEYVGTICDENNTVQEKTFFNEHAFCKNLFFLKNGKGYYIFRGWSKGKLYLSADTFLNYKIKNKLLYLQVPAEFHTTNPYKREDKTEIQVYKKVDSKERTYAEQIYKDDLNANGEIDNNLVGLWNICDNVFWNELDGYIPKINSNLIDKKSSYFIKGLSLYKNGRCIIDEDNNTRVATWTKKQIADTENNVCHMLETKEINGETFLVLKYKTDTYFYDNELCWCYIFKKL